jgi:hypothetical protein
MRQKISKPFDVKNGEKKDEIIEAVIPRESQKERYTF